MDDCCCPFSGGGGGGGGGWRVGGEGFLLFVALRGRRYGAGLRQGSTGALRAEHLQTVQAAEIQRAADHILRAGQGTNGPGGGARGRCLLLYRSESPDGETAEEAAAAARGAGGSDAAMLRSEKERHAGSAEEGIRVIEYGAVGGADEASAAAIEFERLVRSELAMMLDEWCAYTGRPAGTIVGNATVARGSVKKLTRASAAAAAAEELALEEQCHEACAERLSRGLEVTAAPSLLRLLRMVRESRQTILVSGPPGAGKSAMLARAARRFSALGQTRGWLVLKHFAGAGSSGGGSVREMLRRFCLSLATSTGDDAVAASAAGTAGELAQRFLHLAVRATGLMRLSVLVAVDGYDIMDADSHYSSADGLAAGAAHDWIPTADVPGLTILISVCIPDGVVSALAAALRARRPEPLEVQVSAPSSLTDLRLLAVAAMRGSCGSSGAAMASEGRAQALADAASELCPGTAGPVWIAAAARALAIFCSARNPGSGSASGLEAGMKGSAEVDNAVLSQMEAWVIAGKQQSSSGQLSLLENPGDQGKLAGMMYFETAATSALGKALEQVENECGRVMSEMFFTFLLCEPMRGMRESDLKLLLGLELHGIDTPGKECGFEDELREQAARDDWITCLPETRWTRLRRCAAPLLRPADETGEAAFRVADRGVRLALDARYGGTNTFVAEKAHRRLALYLLRCVGGKWSGDGGLGFAAISNRTAGTRAGLQESAQGEEDLHAMAGVAQHLLSGGLWTDCVDVSSITSISWIEIDPPLCQAYIYP